MNSNIFRALVILMLAVTSGVAIADHNDTGELNIISSLPDCYQIPPDTPHAAEIRERHEYIATLRLDLTYNIIRGMAGVSKSSRKDVTKDLIDAYVDLRDYHARDTTDALPCLQAYQLQQRAERLLHDFFILYLLVIMESEEAVDTMTGQVLETFDALLRTAPFYDGDTNLFPAGQFQARP